MSTCEICSADTSSGDRWCDAHYPKPDTTARPDGMSGQERAACVGKWFIEIDKGVRLYCERVADSGPQLAYRPGDPIAVSPQWADFDIFFRKAD